MTTVPLHMHWETEILWSMEVVDGCPFGRVLIEVEVPYFGEERLPWRGRRYFPAFVRVDDEAGIPAHLAHKLAEAVEIATAGALAFDEIDSSPNGVWAA